MKKPYAISVLSYNHPELTAKCLKSVLLYVKSKNIFLTHNESIEKHIARLKDEFSKINHVLIPENKAFSGGANVTLVTSLQKSFKHF